MDILLAAAESIRVAELNAVRMRTGKIQKLHVKRKRGVFKCDQCASVFGLRHNLLRHKRTIHEGKRPFKCNVSGCNASFVQRFDLQTHAASVHDKRKDFNCRICQRAFSQRSNLLTHLRTAHEGMPPMDIQQMLDESCSSSTCSTSQTFSNKPSNDSEGQQDIIQDESTSIQPSHDDYDEMDDNVHVKHEPKHELITPINKEENIEVNTSMDSRHMDHLDDIPVAQLPVTGCTKGGGYENSS